MMVFRFISFDFILRSLNENLRLLKHELVSVLFCIFVKTIQLKAIVIDNEDNIRLGIVQRLKKHCPNIYQVYEANGVETGIKAIQNIQPDIVFLDVEMEDGTGFDLMKRLGGFKFQLIFITAYDKYAVNAFKFSAIDFLLKPIDLDDLIASVNKADKHLKSSSMEMQFQILQESLSSIKDSEKKIVLKDSESIYFVRVSDILYCKAEGPYTEFFLIGQQKITISKTLKDYEDLLEQYGFVRTHRSYLINVKKITRFDKADGGSLVMENNHLVPVSVRKKEEIMEMLNAQ
jgi:two-component system, LytTR family, response regulator